MADTVRKEILMERYVWKAKVKHGMLEEYKRRHGDGEGSGYRCAAAYGVRVLS